MTVMYCDICGQPITPRSKHRLSGTIGQITGAQEVCEECFDAIKRIDWNAAARLEICLNRMPLEAHQS